MRLFFWKKVMKNPIFGTIFALNRPDSKSNSDTLHKGDQIRHEQKTQTPQTFEEISIRE